MTDLEPGQRNKSHTLTVEIFMMQLVLLPSNAHCIQRKNTLWQSRPYIDDHVSILAVQIIHQRAINMNLILLGDKVRRTVSLGTDPALSTSRKGIGMHHIPLEPSPTFISLLSLPSSFLKDNTPTSARREP